MIMPRSMNMPLVIPMVMSPMRSMVVLVLLLVLVLGMAMPAPTMIMPFVLSMVVAFVIPMVVALVIPMVVAPIPQQHRRRGMIALRMLSMLVSRPIHESSMLLLVLLLVLACPP